MTDHTPTGVPAVTEWCREWPQHGDRCNEPAEFVLWGKLFPPEALGPRCYHHAVEHTHHSMPSRVDQWAVLDLRPLAARVSTATGDAGDDVAIRAQNPDVETAWRTIARWDWQAEAQKGYAIRDAVTAGDAAPALTEAASEVNSMHHFHGDDCLCGFSSSRSRSRTEHITSALLAALAARVSTAPALTEAERETRCRREQISHEHYTREAVEQIKTDAYAAGLAARVSTATGVTAGDDLRDRVTALAEAGDRETNWYGHTGYVSTDDLRVALSAPSAPVVSRPEAGA